MCFPNYNPPLLPCSVVEFLQVLDRIVNDCRCLQASGHLKESHLHVLQKKIDLLEEMDRIMYIMKAITYTAARENLASTMNQVCLDCDPIIITRKREQAVVMISLEDYESLEETAYLLRSPANAKRLIESIEAAEKGNLIEKEIDLEG